MIDDLRSEIETAIRELAAGDTIDLGEIVRMAGELLSKASEADDDNSIAFAWSTLAAVYAMACEMKECGDADADQLLYSWLIAAMTTAECVDRTGHVSPGLHMHIITTQWGMVRRLVTALAKKSGLTMVPIEDTHAN